MTAGLGGHNNTPITVSAAATAPTLSNPGPSRPSGAQSAARDVSADSIVRRLFAISMTLASCAKTTDKFAASRVMEAIEGLDHVVSDLRRAIFDNSGTPEPIPVAERDELDRGAWQA